ncbi:DUF3037 domain-containing protein [Aquabacterium sp.]|uniref:DUF3037 domain-containing protein n=1 Tax=Aquabacterium sp. TaxID=1872578 RepID=UPI002487F8EE|nr:DUF3037 domain-containing protein [Aquabacterium sp.]MDI1260254.1 DUF3037 domain-containing protein [Aquabacterium sp.]
MATVPLSAVVGELERVQHVAKEMPANSERADLIRALFTGLTLPREAIVRFGPARPILTNDPMAEVSRLFDHYVDRSFDVWLQKVRRMRKRKLLPQEVLFAVAIPPESDPRRFLAYREICLELQQSDTDVQVVEQNAESAIVRFATR